MQIFFTSKIKFVSLTEFENCAAKKKISFIRVNESPKLGKAVGTKGLGPCIGVSIYNNKKNLVFHYSDVYHFNKPDILKEINKFKSINNLRGMIIGGYEGWHQEVKIFFKNLFDELKIKPTILCGQPNTKELLGTDMFYSAKDDTWFINCCNVETKENKINSPFDLKNYFSFINIAKGNQLFIGDKRSKLNK